MNGKRHQTIVRPEEKECESQQRWRQKDLMKSELLDG